MAREARRISFSLNYANYADIFNHRSMEKDKLSILDVCGAYGQKDIENLDRSGPWRVKLEGSVSHGITQITRIYSIIGAWRRTNYRFWMCVVLTARKTLKI